jgi:hypothetical protein
MEVTLDAFNWHRCRSIGKSPRDYFMLWKDDGDNAAVGPVGIDGWSLGWRHASHGVHIAAAETLHKALPQLLRVQRRHLESGFLRLISETPIDEYGTASASDGYYWLSASPSTAASLLYEAERTDRVSLLRLAEAHNPHRDKAMGARSTPWSSTLAAILEQHLAVLRAAASHEFGLLGHCG